jgi:hypothetical protein
MLFVLLYGARVSPDPPEDRARNRRSSSYQLCFGPFLRKKELLISLLLVGDSRRSALSKLRAIAGVLKSPARISRFVESRPYSTLLLSLSGRSVAPCNEMPANNPRNGNKKAFQRSSWHRSERSSPVGPGTASHPYPQQTNPNERRGIELGVSRPKEPRE